MNIVIWLGLGVWGLALFLVLIGVLRVRRSVVPSSKQSDLSIGISILKPLKGLDEELEENLLSYFQLDYPNFEILFAVRDRDDPAIPLIEKLIAAHPGVDASLAVSQHDLGPNPKVNNLKEIYDKAKNDWVLISDSNVRVDKDELSHLVVKTDDDIGIVTAVVCGFGAKNRAGHMEKLFLNTHYSRWLLVAEWFKEPIVVGKCMFFKRSTAQRFGGLKTLAPFLAEDYVAGIAVQKLGLKVVLSAKPVYQFLGKYSWRKFWNRHVRWGRLRKTQTPVYFLIEPFVTSMGSGLIGALCFYSLLGVSPLYFFMVHIFLWHSADIYSAYTLTGKWSWGDSFFWFIREFLSFPIWIQVAANNNIVWRGQKLKIQSEGIIKNKIHS